ncbi:hypothetical protein Pmani_004649 [Petrolisthes manimaculis]|uniref:Reverse transcriptase domain-containing protein n=1 Tax=Petrolisthes manimaculis TaxID=1843537 RepID=A0AAE1ULD7_9EUCA|nr:hypothetical protein Pmani_004649 [Petrolisthes manimaculis]
MDLFFTNNEDIISGVWTEDTTMSDHKLLIIETTLEYRPMMEINGSGSSSFSTMYFFSDNMDWTSMNNAIKIVNWNQELKDMTTIEMYDFIIEKLLFICSKFVPERKVHRRINNIPRDRKILMRKRTKLAEKILHKEDNRIKEQLWNIEEKLAKSHEAERIKEEEKAVEAISHNPKYFYHYTKMKSNVRSKIGLLKHNGTLVSDPQQMTEAFNMQYVSAFSVRENNQINKELDPVITRTSDIESRDIDLSEIDIEQSISSIRPQASLGPDGVPAILLKQCMKTLSTPIYILWRVSLHTRVIPPILKEGFITPIYKGGDRTEPKNYPPVTLTSHVIKVFEKMVVSKLNEYLDIHTLHNAKQHGFRHGRSCLSQLLQHRMDMLHSLENDATVDVIYLDFLKAFDKDDHQILIQKLSHIGIRGKLLKWIKCFLENRNQAVVVEGVLSGVAQGTPEGQIIEQYRHVKDLGVTLSDDGNFQQQIDNRSYKGETDNGMDTKNLYNKRAHCTVLYF